MDRRTRSPVARTLVSMKSWIAFTLAGLGIIRVATASVANWTRTGQSNRSESSGRVRFARTFDVASFSKGNLHAHTNRSDGDSSPEDVIAWYRRAGYAFLAITDHNRFFDPRRFEWLEGPDFKLLQGEEITMTGGGGQVHVNAICTNGRIPGGAFASTSKALQFATGAIQKQDGIALINHPNFDRGLSIDDLASARGAALLEIMSGHPYVYSLGTGSRPKAEEIWENTLDRDMGFMAVAVDDVHRFRVDGSPPAYPGFGWVEVFGAPKERSGICDALRKGALYASTGVTVRRIAVTGGAYTIWPTAPGTTVTFIGADDAELARFGPLRASVPASYRLEGTERYVRARLDGPGGAEAWTPAVAVATISESNLAH